MWVAVLGSACRVAVFMYGGLAMCFILVGLVISNDTFVAYFVLFLLRNKKNTFLIQFNVWMCGLEMFLLNQVANFQIHTTNKTGINR